MRKECQLKKNISLLKTVTYLAVAKTVMCVIITECVVCIATTENNTGLIV